MSKRCTKKELLVAGYVREIENHYKIRNIPTEIKDMIYLYQQFHDIWSEKYSHKDIIIDRKKGTFKVTSKYDITVYGSQVVSSGTSTWKIKILWTPQSELESWIGIIEDKSAEILAKYANDFAWDRFGYQLSCFNGLLYSGMEKVRSPSYGCEWKRQGDIMEMTLDLNEGTLKFKVNDRDFGVAFKNIKQSRYRLALSTYDAEEAEFMMFD